MSLSDQQATLLLLVSEARRLDIATVKKANGSLRTEEMKELNQKWGQLKREMLDRLYSGECLRTVRAMLACRYPFLGVKTPENLEESKRKKGTSFVRN